MQEHRTESASTAMKVNIERSIKQIDPVLWDAINASQGLYWTHRFVHCMESSSVEDAEYWYFIVSLGEEPVATAVLSSFVVSLDLLLPVWVQRFCSVIRRIYPSFLRLRMLFCGMPISIGKHTLTVSDKLSAEYVLDELNRAMLRIASDDGIRYLCFKEFTGKDLPTVDSLKNHGYFRACSIPRVELNLRWESFEEYLNSMRHGYRRMVRQSLAQIGINPATESILKDDNNDSSAPRLVVRRFTREMAAVTHKLYLEVMRKAEVKLEILNRRFFENLSAEMSDDLISICLEDNDGIQGTALLGRNGDCLNFLFAGFSYENRDRYRTYFNLLNGIIAYGIEHGFEKIDMGQTTYRAKQRLGGKAEPVYFYLRALSPTVQQILRFLNPILFPAARIQKHRVFRESAQ
jgi:predicted N-acyltransferase